MARRARLSAARLIAAPFHDGLHGVDRGLGPARLLAAAGVPEERVDTIGPGDQGAPEAARVFALAGRIAAAVRAAAADGTRPVVLAGDCNSCLGTVAGVGAGKLGVVWLDAHADFDTPDDSRSGSLDAMGLALLTGAGWPALRATVPGLHPVAEEDVVLVGVRDLEPHQRERLERSRIRTPPARDLGAALDELRARAGRVYLHVDLDVLDPSEGIANRYAAPGGLRLDELLAAVAAVRERFEVAAAALTAYEPAADADGRMAATGARVLAALGQA